MGLYLAGAGGVGREALDVALARDLVVEAFLDERAAGSVVRGRPVLALDAAPPGSTFLVGIADPYVRGRLADVLQKRGLVPASLVHPRAVVGPDTVIGAGSLVHAHAFISSSCVLAPHSQVHYSVSIGHDCVLDPWASVFPGANIAGAVRIEENATVGSNAVVLQGLRVGTGAFVGAGAVVTKDVAPHTVVTGSPARPRPRDPVVPR